MKPRLRLIVIRSLDIEALKKFYEALGISFKKERHGFGPFHYAARAGGCVFEIYATGTLLHVDRATLGFEVDSIDRVFQNLQGIGIQQTKRVETTSQGKTLFLVDPDGRTVLLTERLSHREKREVFS